MCPWAELAAHPPFFCRPSLTAGWACIISAAAGDGRRRIQPFRHGKYACPSKLTYSHPLCRLACFGPWYVRKKGVLAADFLGSGLHDDQTATSYICGLAAERLSRSLRRGTSVKHRTTCFHQSSSYAFFQSFDRIGYLSTCLYVGSLVPWSLY
ncbi:hypothetical protein BX600DRAFT_450332 [Xylariales sp. PMI_506]|nr:hypothetical protein BX600DRAFT_450332 [Xylariales sp. PMI_506]